MSMNKRGTQPPFKVRPLAAVDLDLVVEIDAAAFGHPRRPYFERRVAAALREPALNVQIGIEDRGTLAGFVLARKLEGEFGRPDPALRLEVIGVDTSEQAHGIGTQLLEALEAEAKKRAIYELRTQASWRDHVMLRFLDHHGFSLGKNQVIDCAVEAGAFGPAADKAFAAPERVNQARELDYSAPEANDYEQMARDVADVRTLARGDLPDLARIDHKLTGRDRSSYITHQFDQTLFDADPRLAHRARGRCGCGIPDGERRPGRLPQCAGGGDRHAGRGPDYRPRAGPRALDDGEPGSIARRARGDRGFTHEFRRAELFLQGGIRAFGAAGVHEVARLKINAARIWPIFAASASCEIPPGELLPGAPNQESL